MSDASIDAPDDVRAWVIRDEDVKEDDALEGVLFCPECVTRYIGGGEAWPVHHDRFLADAFCDDCGVFLGDE